MAEERVEPEGYVEPEGEQHAQERTAAWLPWVVLLLVVAALAWLFWRYAEIPSTTDSGDSTAVLTAARVPDVVGMESGAASTMIERAGFAVEADSTFTGDVAPGTVASQQPEGGSKHVKGSVVVIVVATEVGQATGAPGSAHDDRASVPNVVGLTELRARDVLESTGYRISVTQGYSSSKPLGVIYVQAPESATYAPAGTTVSVKVSLGPPPPGKTQVPNVIGQTSKQAIDTLEDAGLDPRAMVQYHPEFSKTVFQQNPAAGTLVSLGSKVFVLSGE